MPLSRDDERRRLAFGAAADLYDSARPSYPHEAVRWLLGEAPLRVVDLGAGTGIFSRVLTGLGHEVIAVEPDPGMRRRLSARSPDLTVLDGAAERIPLPDGSVDAVVAAQSSHWFDPDAAHPEIARVLRVGGIYGPIWNSRDESTPWVAELTRVAGLGDRAGSSGRRARRAGFGPWFEPSESAEFRHSVAYTGDSLLALVRSRSAYLVADDAQRRSIDAGVRSLTSGLPEPFELPYVTVAVRARRFELGRAARSG